MKPLLRWAGSKRALLPMLREYWQTSCRRYVEPFCGSACLFFDLEPPQSILGDLNAELIRTYSAIRRDPTLVCECIRRLPRGEKAYYRIRNSDPTYLSDAELAARFLYLNRYCFNGIYRTNGQGKFNVPYGPPKGGTDFNYQAVIDAALMLRKTTLVHGDFEGTLSRVQKGDFVYLDPPFAVSRRRIFAEYHPDAFRIADLSRLQRSLELIERRGALFIVSYADSAEARRLLAPWKPRRVRTRRNIAGFAGARRDAFELLASNLGGDSNAD